MPFNSIRFFYAGLDENNGILKEPKGSFLISLVIKK